jgi:transposase
MLRQIALLYQVEKTVRGKEASLRLAARREHAGPIIAALKPWLEIQLSRIPQNRSWPRTSATRWHTGPA